MITIRPFQRADRDALYDMLAPIWPTETAESLDRRWWWRHETPPLTIAIDENNAIAGMVGAIPFRAHAHGREHRGAWIVDFFVSSRHQGLGIGKKMVASVLPNFDFLASLNQTDAAWAAFKRLGWTERSFAPLFLLPSTFAYRLLTTGGRRAAASMPATAAPAFGAEFDAFWERIQSQFGAVSLRDSSELAKRFTGARRGEVLVQVHSGDRLEAYAVVRELPPGSIRSFSGFPILMVSDYLAPPDRPELFATLVDAVVSHARVRGIRFVLCMSTQAAHQRWLRRGAFLSAQTPVVGERLRKLDVGFTTTPGAPVGPWHLTPFDCDLDILFGGQA